MRGLALAALAVLTALALAGCGAPAGSAYPLQADPDARRWGDGPYGLVLLPDGDAGPAAWDEQARTLAGEGMTVVAVADGSASVAAEAINALRAAGVARVAVLAAGNGTDAALQLGAERPELVDQLILVSAHGDVEDLGVFPKLFVASEGEAAAADAERMADAAPGDWNALYLAPGSDSGRTILTGEAGDEAMEAIQQRLEERR
ncbi:MAG TPA: alpha/beta hydrolase [Candidatus Limnocylindria bacterium]